MCALTKKKLLKKKKANGFSGAFQASRRIFFTTPESYATRSMEKHWTGEDASHFKNRKKKWFDRYFFKHCRGSWRGEKRFRWGLCTGTFCCRLGGSWENWGGPCSFLHLLLLPLFYFFFFKTIFCAVLVVVVVVCALNLIQRAGTGDENFSIQNLGAREGGAQRAQLKWMKKNFNWFFFFLCVHLR